MQSVSRSDCRLWSCFLTKWGSKPPRWSAPPRRGAGVALALSQQTACPSSSSLTAVSSVASRTENGHVSLALPDTIRDVCVNQVGACEAMGPTSQGPTTSSNLAVEHYLGSCLISATARKHPAKHEFHPQQQQHHHQQHHAQPPPPYNGWTGMPLISMAAAGRRTGKECVQTARSPLSRLAIHTQGAPLILAGHYGRGNNNNNKGPHQMGHKGPQVPLRLIVPKHHPSGPILTPLMRNQPPKTPGSPPVSDNVSVASDESSGHSENSLPRIIKPRKRRKKERKPSNSSSGGTPETETPPGGQQQPTSIVTLQPYVPLCYEFDKFKQRAARKPDKIAPIQCVVAAEVMRPELDEDLHPALCQCSLCDPAGLIFDVERLCHSPTLLSPPLYRVSSAPPIGWRRDELFRTTSEPVQAPAAKPTEYCVQHELEVTSEIVTCLNGHRDIEIRFFVPSSCSSHGAWKPPASEE